MVLTVIAHLGVRDAGWSTLAAGALLAAITVIGLGQAADMVRRGPLSRLRVPAGWAAAERVPSGD